MRRNIKAIDGIRCTYTDKVITVKKSYRIRYDDVADFCVKLKEELPFKYKRTPESWAREIIAHNFFYEINMFKDHAEDTDIDENESAFRLFVYDVIYLLYRSSLVNIISGFISPSKRR